MKRKPAPRKPSLLLIAAVVLFVLLLLLRLFVFVHGRGRHLSNVRHSTHAAAIARVAQELVVKSPF